MTSFNVSLPEGLSTKEIFSVRVERDTKTILRLAAHEALQHTTDRYGRITPSVPNFLDSISLLYDPQEVESLPQQLLDKVVNKRLVTARLTPKNYEKLERVAKSSQMTVSDVMNYVIEHLEE